MVYSYNPRFLQALKCYLGNDMSKYQGIARLFPNKQQLSILMLSESVCTK